MGLIRKLAGALSADRRVGATAEELKAVVPIFLATRVGVLAVGYFAVAAFGYEGGQPPLRLYDSELLNLPFRYDAGWYFQIASEGYRWDPSDPGQQSIAFFPAFPIAARLVGELLGVRFLAAAMLLTLGCALAALLYFHRLAREYLTDDEAAAAVAFLAAYPFAVFYSVPYTESLFLLATLGAWWHFRREQFLRAAVWGLIAGLARPNGALLSVPLAIMAVTPFMRGHKQRMGVPLVAAAAPAVGMLLFSGFIYRLTGNPAQWSIVHAAWGRTYTPIVQLVVDWFHTPAFFSSTVGSAAMVDYVTGLIVALNLILTVPVYRRFGLAAATFIPLCLLPPLFAGGLLSMGRLTAVVFPVFLWLGGSVPPAQRPAWLAVFAMGQALAAAMFFTWRSVF